VRRDRAKSGILAVGAYRLDQLLAPDADAGGSERWRGVIGVISAIDFYEIIDKRPSHARNIDG
jgi:hypothetical protein